MKNKSVSRGLLGPEIPAKMEAVEAGSCRGRLIDAYVQRELSPSEAGALKIVSLHLQSAGEGRVCARAYVGPNREMLTSSIRRNEDFAGILIESFGQSLPNLGLYSSIAGTDSHSCTRVGSCLTVLWPVGLARRRHSPATDHAKLGTNRPSRDFARCAGYLSNFSTRSSNE